MFLKRVVVINMRQHFFEIFESYARDVRKFYMYEEAKKNFDLQFYLLVSNSKILWHYKSGRRCSMSCNLLPEIIILKKLMDLTTQDNNLSHNTPS